MKRILINATQNEEIRVALCKGNHLYDFDLENRTREQKKSNIYKGHVTRVEPSLEAVFVEYGSQRQGFLPIREISAEYLSGNPRDENIKKLIKEGDELIVQVEKEERGNKGAALSTYVSLAGRYLVLMPNNPRGGGISRQISGKLREDMKRMLGNLDLPKGMSVIIRTAGIGKTQEDLQHDLNHLLNIWQAIQEQNQKYPSPRLVHQEAGVVTRAVRDYLRDDIAEIWIDNENAYIEAAGFIDAVMPTQAEKLRKYTDYEPMFSRFNIEKQIETAYQREVRLPSGGSIVIDQTEALVSIDINSAKSTKGSDVAETAYHTNLEAADEIARQLRLRDMGGLIVIDFIDMNDNKHQKEVEKRLIDATKYDRARVQFGDISKFGLMEMSRQRLRPSLEESTGYICPRCHGNGMIRDLRSLSLSIMRQIEQIALKERQGEVQAEVPTDIAAFLLNEKRDSLVYLEQDSGTRITILPHAHLESPNFKLHFNRDGFAPTSYERITDTQQQEHSDLGYDVDWQTAEKERPEQQPTRQPRNTADSQNTRSSNISAANGQSNSNDPRKHNNHSENSNTPTSSSRAPQNNSNQGNPVQNAQNAQNSNAQNNNAQSNNSQNSQATQAPVAAQSNTVPVAQPQAVAWLSNLFAQAPQAQTTASVSSRDAAEAIEALVNTGAQSLGSFGQVDNTALSQGAAVSPNNSQQTNNQQASRANTNRQQQQRASSNSVSDNSNNTASNDTNEELSNNNADDRRKRKPPRKSRSAKPHQRRDQRDENDTSANVDTSANANVNSNSNNTTNTNASANAVTDNQADNANKREQDSSRGNERNRNRNDSERNTNERNSNERQDSSSSDEQTRPKRKPHSLRNSRGKLERGETLSADAKQNQAAASLSSTSTHAKAQVNTRRNQDPNEVILQVNEAPAKLKNPEVVHLSLDDSKSGASAHKSADKIDSNAKNDGSNVNNNASAAAQPTEDQQLATATTVTTDDHASVNPATNHSEQAISKQAAEKQPTAIVEPTVEVVTAQPIADTDVQEPTTEAVVADVTAAVVTTAATEEVTSSETNVDAKADGHSANSTEVHATAIDNTQTANTVAEATSVESSASPSLEINDSAKAEDSTKDKDATVELTHQSLFASRYVTAKKFGQASNDPRVVRRQQAATPAEQVLETITIAVAAKARAIGATVGEFIHATLPDAQSYLADHGVIRSFIEAVAVHNQQMPDAATDVAQPQAITNSAEQDKGHAEPESDSFTFSNYGYQPLEADYLAGFKAMTQAVGQFATTPGSTAVEPRAIGKRASNDPRGQHPSYQQQALLETSSDVQSVAETQSNDDTQSADDAVNIAADQAAAVSNSEQVDAHKVTATALTEQAQADHVSAESEQLLQDDQGLEAAEVIETVKPIATLVVEPATEPMLVDAVKDDSQAGKSKTTIASYKNMIENVAEQLLPQTGMFNLTSPKVPKARSRKPKTEHKKPTQAEKIEANSGNDSSENSSNTDS
jgi:ribonuclease E